MILIFIMSPPSKKWQTNKPTNRLKVTKKMNVSTWNRVNFVICDKYAVQKKKLTQNSNERFETTRNWNVIKKTNIPSKDRILVNRWGRHQFFSMTSHHSLLYLTYTRAAEINCAENLPYAVDGTAPRWRSSRKNILFMGKFIKLFIYISTFRLRLLLHCGICSYYVWHNNAWPIYCARHAAE